MGSTSSLQCIMTDNVIHAYLPLCYGLDPANIKIHDIIRKRKASLRTKFALKDVVDLSKNK